MALNIKSYKFIIILFSFIVTLLVFIGVFGDDGEIYEEIKNNYISNEINIYRNEYGLPKIKCNNLNDFYFALGYITAKDRLLQLELSRRIAKGELSEFVNSDYIKLDKIIKDLKFDYYARKKKSGLDSLSTKLFQNYVNGINSYLNLQKNRLPFEFGVTNHKLNEFTILDILLIDELFSFQKDNKIKESLFLLMSQINLGKTKTSKLFNDLGITYDSTYYNLVSTRKFTYGDLKYLYDLYTWIDQINQGRIEYSDPVFITKYQNSYLLSYTNISKSWLNNSEYYIESEINDKYYSFMFDVGSITPNIMRIDTSMVFSKLNNVESNFNINLYDVVDKKYLFRSYQDTNYTKFKISIDTIKYLNNEKYYYSYQIDSSRDLLIFSDDLRNFGISISKNYKNSNWYNYYFSKVLNKNQLNYFGEQKSFLIIVNDTIKRQDLSINENQELKDINTIFQSKYISENKNIFNNRINELLLDDHNFTITDLKLINNDNKNILASKYLKTILSVVKNTNSKNANEIRSKLKKWDYLDDINNKYSELFNQLINKFTQKYLDKVYNKQTSELLNSIPQLKHKLTITLLKRLKNDEDLKNILRNSISELDLKIKIRNNEVSHILNKYKDNKIISLSLQNLQAGFSSIRYYYSYKNNQIMNNSSLLFYLNYPYNSLMMLHGASNDIKSEWHTNLYELWKTGGTIESKFGFENCKLIVKISNEN